MVASAPRAGATNPSSTEAHARRGGGGGHGSGIEVGVGLQQLARLEAPGGGAGPMGSGDGGGGGDGLEAVGSPRASGLDSPPASPSAPVTFRQLRPMDFEQVKHIHQLVFPIRYPDTFYADATSGTSGLFTCAAVDEQNRVVGVIVGSLVKCTNCDAEDKDLLEPPPTPTDDGPVPAMMYILTLGVLPTYKRRGLGSMLVGELMSHAAVVRQKACRVVYLHVLASNMDAVHFYEKLGFQNYKSLPDYYSIDGKYRNAYTFVKYLNGGQPPATFAQSVSVFFTQAARLLYECCLLLRRKT